MADLMAPEARRRASERRAPHAAQLMHALAQFVLLQVAADEDDLRFALLARPPFALRVAVEDHVHALKHEALGIVLERENAFRAKDVGPLALHEIVDPGQELVGIDVAVDAHGDRLHLLVVIMLQALVRAVAMMLMMIMVVVVMPIVMRVVVMAVVVMIVVVLPGRPGTPARSRECGRDRRRCGRAPRRAARRSASSCAAWRKG